MPPRKKREDATDSAVKPVEDFTAELISSLNKDMGQRVAFNLSSDEAPTVVKQWVSTGSRQLDYAIAGRSGGGLPVGRIVEIFGPPSIGKSHIAYASAQNIQNMGGLVVYIDTENATSIEKLKMMGIDVSKRFVYCDTHCTGEAFTIAEKTVLKAKDLASTSKAPILVVWDSVAATSPKAELEGDYDSSTIGLQARTISKGMRKITGIIGDTNALMFCCNQIRQKIGVMYGDPNVTPGGMAIPFHASVRISLTGGGHLKHPKTGEIYGIEVNAFIKKNKISAPYRKVSFEIHFGKGIVEHEQIFDVLRQHGPVKSKDYEIRIEGEQAWKQLLVTSNQTGEHLVEKKFHKADFDAIIKDPEYSLFIDEAIDAAYANSFVDPSNENAGSVDDEKDPENE